MTEPTDAEQYLNVADQCAATATSELAASILVDGGNGTLRQLLNDAADAIRVGWATPPTQAQAGAVPLTDEQLPLLRFATSSLFHLFERWNNKEIPHYQLMDEMGQVVEHVIRRTMAAHGIKGGQHGAE